jgi:hypothetical protein
MTAIIVAFIVGAVAGGFAHAWFAKNPDEVHALEQKVEDHFKK